MGTALFTGDELGHNEGYFNDRQLVVIRADTADIVKNIIRYYEDPPALYELSLNGQKRINQLDNPRARIRKTADILMRAAG